ncbi:hypothetical protein BH11PSE11_BH11PSE11_20050 [soil metagenome]
MTPSTESLRSQRRNKLAVDILALESESAALLRTRIAALVSHADRDEATLAGKAVDLVDQADIGGPLEGLVLQLREANQNLVIATFSAQDLQAKAETANLRQEEFLSMLAHELRNPLAPVAMAAELIGRITDAHPQLPKLHAVIKRQVSHMTRIVDDLLDASRASSGKIAIQKSLVLLREVIESAVETSQPFIDKRRHVLKISLPEQAVVIDGDPVRLSQVFSNLLINASKFTPENGQISLTAQLLPQSVSIKVKDNGIGIAPEFQAFVFDLFRQGPRSLDRTQGGLGIGLSLVRTVVELHGGTSAVRSAGAGLGSEFVVVLPISLKCVPAAAPTPPAALARHCRILLIEDNHDANDVMNELLTLDGHTVTSAFDSVTGIELATQNVYDIIVCDIGLPGMDGYEVVRHLRASADRPLPTFIGMSGYNQPESRLRAIEVGFDHYLVKPVSVASLSALIAASACGCD